MSELNDLIVGILGTVIAALIVSIILGIVWMRKAIADQKSAHSLMEQRLKYNEDKLDKIETTHADQYHELAGKMDKMLSVLSDVKLAFSEVRVKNTSNERRIDRLEQRA